MKLPRILLAAPSSGSGKTLITCGLLQVLVNRGLKTASFKCGPDYIDPMFHSKVIGTKSRNLDTFFTDKELTGYLFQENSRDCQISVMEGVMGYYDGLGGTSLKASAYDLASVTNTPVILVVNCKGMSRSICAFIKGFIEYEKDSRIQGVIFNQISPMLYPRIKEMVQSQLPVRVLGYLPKVDDCQIESRHLGLVLPDEIKGLRDKLQKLAGIMEDTLDIDAILELAGQAGEWSEITQEQLFLGRNPDYHYQCSRPVRIAVAKDEAFCFFYEDNFRLLEKMGARLIGFSPVHDQHLPEDIDGLLLYGGYPELYGETLEKNETMREDIQKKIKEGLPCMAECGGFMYLHEYMEDIQGNLRKMAGVISGKSYRTKRLQRFGYITLSAKKPVFHKKLEPFPAHEFHYFDSDDCGNDFRAEKYQSSRGWECMHVRENLAAGFPHLYYYSNPSVAAGFLEQCQIWQKEKRRKKL